MLFRSKGTTTLRSEGVQVRGIDPVPQAGVLRLFRADARQIEVSFQRLDAERIQVSVTAGGRTLKFVVKPAGTVEPAG